MKYKSILVVAASHSSNLSRVLTFLSTYPGEVFLIQNTTDDKTRDLVKIINCDPNSRQNLSFISNPREITWGKLAKKSLNLDGCFREFSRVLLRRKFIRQLVIRNGRKMYFYVFRFEPLRPLLLTLKAWLLKMYFGPVIAGSYQEGVPFNSVSIESQQLSFLATRYDAKMVVFVDLEVDKSPEDNDLDLELLSIKGQSVLANLRDMSLANHYIAQFNFDWFQKHLRTNSQVQQDSVLFISGRQKVSKGILKMEVMELLNVARHMGVKYVDVFSQSGYNFSSNLLEKIETHVTERAFFEVESEFFTFLNTTFPKYRFVVFNGTFLEGIPWVDYFRAAAIYQTKVFVPQDFPHAGGAIAYSSDIELDLRDKVLTSTRDSGRQLLIAPYALTLEQWLELELNKTFPDGVTNPRNDNI